MAPAVLLGDDGGLDMRSFVVLASLLLALGSCGPRVAATETAAPPLAKTSPPKMEPRPSSPPPGITVRLVTLDGLPVERFDAHAQCALISVAGKTEKGAVHLAVPGPASCRVAAIPTDLKRSAEPDDMAAAVGKIAGGFVRFPGGSIELEARPSRDPPEGRLVRTSPDPDGTYDALNPPSEPRPTKRTCSNPDPFGISPESKEQLPLCPDPRARFRDQTQDPRSIVRTFALLDYFESPSVLAGGTSPVDPDRARILMATVAPEARIWADHATSLRHAVQEAGDAQAERYAEQAMAANVEVRGFYYLVDAQQARRAGRDAEAEAVLERLRGDDLKNTMAARMAQFVARRRPRAPVELPSVSLPVVVGESSTISTEPYRKRVAVLQFWTTWCKGCPHEMEELEQLHPRFAKRGVDFVSISADEDVAKVREFFEKRAPPPWPIAHIPSLRHKDVLAQFDVDSYPTLLISDGNGKMIRLGSMVHKDDIAARIESLLAGQRKRPRPRTKSTDAVRQGGVLPISR